MKGIDLLLAVVIVAVCFSAVNLVITINKIVPTGFATDTGTANLTIQSAAAINFTTFTIDWGTGQVDESPAWAYVDSEGGDADGNWTTVSQGLTVQNNGNCNVSLNLTASKDAAAFIGGTTPTFKLKITDNESGSCSGTNSLISYDTATGAMQKGCSDFSYYNDNDALNIDVNLTIPQDAGAGAKTCTITATVTVL